MIEGVKIKKFKTIRQDSADTLRLILNGAV